MKLPGGKTISDRVSGATGERNNMVAVGVLRKALSPVQLFEVLKYFSGLNFLIHANGSEASGVPKAKISKVGLALCLLQNLLSVYLCVSGDRVSYVQDMSGRIWFWLVNVINRVVVAWMIPGLGFLGIYLQWQKRNILAKKTEELKRFLRDFGLAFVVEEIERRVRLYKLIVVVYVAFLAAMGVMQAIVTHKTIPDMLGVVFLRVFLNINTLELCIQFQQNYLMFRELARIIGERDSLFYARYLMEEEEEVSGVVVDWGFI